MVIAGLIRPEMKVEIGDRAEVMTADWQNGGFGLYVHCRSALRNALTAISTAMCPMPWTKAAGRVFRSEIRRIAELVPGRVLNSIFFGGGTPSLMLPETVHAVIDEARAAWNFANDIEISMEANPGSVEADRFRGYAEAGVDRLSMGIQALNDQDLRRLGRMHSVAEARQAFDLARENFGRVSFDLIYARQDQSREAWRGELREAVAMAVDHLSVYQLTIEQGTVFGARHKRGLLRGLPDDDLAADMYLETQETLQALGMPGYEISNHAATASESRHNLIYWRQGDRAAIGPGAHGRLTAQGKRFATVAETMPERWLALVEAQGSGDVSADALAADEIADEYLLMSMRLSEGMDEARYRRLGGGFDEPRLARAMDDGLIARRGGRLAATPKGRPVLNYILREIAA